jgi:hypothetical protein
MSTRSQTEEMAQICGEAVSLADDTIHCSPHRSRRNVLIKSSIEEANIATLRAQKQGTSVSTPTIKVEEQLYPWIKTQYHSKSSFISTGFIGWKRFENVLINQKPQEHDQIISALGQ